MIKKNETIKFNLKTLIVTQFLLFSISMAPIGLADDAPPIKFPLTIYVGNKTLELNGSGVRQVSFFNVDVYAAALYSEHRSGDAQVLLSSGDVKQIDMKFLHAVRGKDVNEGDSMSYVFYPDRVEVIVKRKPKPPIAAPGFSQLLLSTWLGDHPPTEALKKGLLGKK